MGGSIEIRAVVRRTFRIYVDQAPLLMPTAAVVFALSSVLGELLVASSPAAALLAGIVALVATTLFTGMIVELVADVRAGRPEADIGRLLGAVRPVFGKLVAVALAVLLTVGLIVGVGTDFVAALLIGTSLGNSVAGIVVAVLFGVVLFALPAVCLQTVWSLAAPVVVLERPVGLRALRRSRELVRGNVWRVFWVILLLVFLVEAVSGGVTLLGDSAGTAVGLVARVVVGILAAPISALAEAVLYFELRESQVREEPGRSEDAGPFQAGPFPPAIP